MAVIQDLLRKLTGPTKAEKDVQGRMGLTGAVLRDPTEPAPEGYTLVGMKAGKRIYQPAGEVATSAKPVTIPERPVYGAKTVAREEAARAAARQRVLDAATKRKDDLAKLRASEAAYVREAAPKPGQATPEQAQAFNAAVIEKYDLNPAEQNQLFSGVLPDRVRGKENVGIDYNLERLQGLTQRLTGAKLDETPSESLRRTARSMPSSVRSSSFMNR